MGFRLFVAPLSEARGSGPSSPTRSPQYPLPVPCATSASRPPVRAHGMRATHRHRCPARQRHPTPFGLFFASPARARQAGDAGGGDLATSRAQRGPPRSHRSPDACMSGSCDGWALDVSPAPVRRFGIFFFCVARTAGEGKALRFPAPLLAFTCSVTVRGFVTSCGCCVVALFRTAKANFISTT